MTYANILVAVDLGEAAPERVRLAAGLARRFEATLTGAAAEAVPAPALVRDIYDAQRQEAENAARVSALLDRAGAVFAAQVGAGLRTDWRAALAGPVTHVVERARAADLVVVGRHAAEDAAPRRLDVPPGPVLMEAGRPVLVVPPGIAQLRGARVVVAWKDGVAARRAVASALPFLRDAEQVHVASAGAAPRPEEGAAEVAAHLARHGAAVTTHDLRTAGDGADAILRFAQAQGADLIVMGAYGHSRLRDWVFGGLTRDFLQRCPVCCLMSH